MKLFVGIGNEIMGDDQIGIAVTRKLYERFKDKKGVCFITGSFNGMKLFDVIKDADEVVIIDSIVGKEEGKLHKLDIDEVDRIKTIHPHSLGIALPVKLSQKYFGKPVSVKIYAIEVKEENLKFSENISFYLKAKIEKIADIIAKNELSND